MLTNGFTIVRTSIPDYLIWIYYGLNPLSYGVRALAINELTSPSWGRSGYIVLEQFKFFTEKEWIWIAVGFNWGFLFLLVIVGALALRYINPPSPKPSVSLEEQKVLTEQGIGKFIKKRRSTIMSRAAKSFKTLTSLGSSRQASDMVIENQPPRRQKAMPVAFQPVAIVCKNLCYYVRDPSGGTAPGVVKEDDDKEIAGKLQLLHDINFYVEPGMLTALMGGSGAGKTTLMDVVAGRKTQGIIKGEILANGRIVEPQIWSRVVGYVEQMDVHSACITVLESLRFAARLRLSEKDVSDAQVEAIVQETLSTIELEKLKDLVVGNPGGEGLSIEQRKRLSIGVELVGNPSVLFMVSIFNYRLLQSSHKKCPV
jgi:ABC-type multidrug transport system fused ATPase/permease subunit